MKTESKTISRFTSHHSHGTVEPFSPFTTTHPKWWKTRNVFLLARALLGCKYFHCTCTRFEEKQNREPHRTPIHVAGRTKRSGTFLHRITNTGVMGRGGRPVREGSPTLSICFSRYALCSRSYSRVPIFCYLVRASSMQPHRIGGIPSWGLILHHDVHHCGTDWLYDVVGWTECNDNICICNKFYICKMFLIFRFALTCAAHND